MEYNAELLEVLFVLTGIRRCLRCLATMWENNYYPHAVKYTRHYFIRSILNFSSCSLFVLVYIHVCTSNSKGILKLYFIITKNVVCIQAREFKLAIQRCVTSESQELISCSTSKC